MDTEALPLALVYAAHPGDCPGFSSGGPVTRTATSRPHEGTEQQPGLCDHTGERGLACEHQPCRVSRQANMLLGSHATKT